MGKYIWKELKPLIVQDREYAEAHMLSWKCQQDMTKNYTYLVVVLSDH